MASKSPSPAPKPQVDWEAVEMQYRAGIRSLKEIGKEFGVSDAGIIKRAKRDGWTRMAKVAKRSSVIIKEEKDPMESGGFLYVLMIDTGADRYFKIGMSKNFSARLEAHQCASPFPLLVACCYFTGCMRAEERELHRIYAGKHVRGEWYALDDADLKNIAQRSLLISHD